MLTIVCKGRLLSALADDRLQPEAPSERELSPKVTEGECVAMYSAHIRSHTVSFRHSYAVPPFSWRKSYVVQKKRADMEANPYRLFYCL